MYQRQLLHVNFAVVKNRKPGRKREKVDVPVAGNTKINGGLLSETAGTAVAHIQTGGLTDRAGTLNGISDRIDFELNLNGCSSALGMCYESYLL